MPDCDVLVVAGDFLGQGKFFELQDFISWLREQPAKHKIVVAGNHDLILEEPSSECVFTDDIHYLQDSGVTIHGVKFYGSPWTPLFGRWSWMKPDSELGAIWDKIPDDVDVLITHGPPKGVLDYVKRGGHVGSESLAIQLGSRLRPKIWIGGHLHENGGQSHVKDGTVYFNVASMDERYCLRPNPWTVISL